MGTAAGCPRFAPVVWALTLAKNFDRNAPLACLLHAAKWDILLITYALGRNVSGKRAEQLPGGTVTPAIQQSVEFAVSPETLYELYMDSKKHSQATDAPAKLSRRVGGSFTAFGGRLEGKNLLLVPNKTIVQTWRSTGWKKSDPDSILVIQFSKTKGGTRVDLVHVGVPEHDHQGVTEGWQKYYWRPWHDYLTAAEWKAERRRKR